MQAQADADSDSYPNADPYPNADSDPDPDPDSYPDSDPDPDPDSYPDSYPDSDSYPNADPDADSDADADADPYAYPEADYAGPEPNYSCGFTETGIDRGQPSPVHSRRFAFGPRDRAQPRSTPPESPKLIRRVWHGDGINSRPRRPVPRASLTTLAAHSPRLRLGEWAAF